MIEPKRQGQLFVVCGVKKGFNAGSYISTRLTICFPTAEIESICTLDLLGLVLISVIRNLLNCKHFLIISIDNLQRATHNGQHPKEWSKLNDEFKKTYPD